MKPNVITTTIPLPERILLHLTSLVSRVPALAVSAFFCAHAHTSGQSTTTFTFEAEPRGSTGTASVYFESGMRFLNPSGPQPVVLNGGGISWAPENGTGYMQLITGGVAFSFTSGAHFDLLSFDAAGYSTSFPGPVSLELVGYGSMGLRMTNYIDVGSFLDRRANQLPDFQTFYPDLQFGDLYRVDILADHWSLDNVVISVVPEPSTGALGVLGAACLFWFTRAGTRRYSESAPSTTPASLRTSRKSVRNWHRQIFWEAITERVNGVLTNTLLAL